MSIKINKAEYPYLLNRIQAAKFLGIDPVSFDKYVRPNDSLERFMLGRHERYTREALIEFIEDHLV